MIKDVGFKVASTTTSSSSSPSSSFAEKCGGGGAACAPRPQYMYPVVQFECGRVVKVLPQSFDYKLMGVGTATRIQVRVPIHCVFKPIK